MISDPFKVLGVASDCSDADLKKAYRDKSKKWHPDQNPDNEEYAEKRFKEVQEAYRQIQDARQRGTSAYGNAGGAPYGGRGYGQQNQQEPYQQNQHQQGPYWQNQHQQGPYWQNQHQQNQYQQGPYQQNQQGPYQQNQQGAYQQGAYQQNQQGPYQQSQSQQNGYQSQRGYADYGTYNDFFNQWFAYSQQKRQQEAQAEFNEELAARNYINNRAFREALNTLNNTSLNKRGASWYYYSAVANSGIGNNVTALEHAKRAADMEPNNPEYQTLLQQLVNGRNWYQNQNRNFGFSGTPATTSQGLCYYFCLANLLCNCCFGGIRL